MCSFDVPLILRRRRRRRWCLVPSRQQTAVDTTCARHVHVVVVQHQRQRGRRGGGRERGRNRWRRALAFTIGKDCVSSLWYAAAAGGGLRNVHLFYFHPSFRQFIRNCNLSDFHTFYPTNYDSSAHLCWSSQFSIFEPKFHRENSSFDLCLISHLIFALRCSWISIFLFWAVQFLSFDCWFVPLKLFGWVNINYGQLPGQFNRQTTSNGR